MLSGVQISPGTIIDRRFKVRGLIGEGGMGAVYEAEQSGFDRIVALKILHRSVDDLEHERNSFLREGKILSRLVHPGIVRLFSCGFSEDGHPYLCLELCDGATLRSHLSQEKILPLSEALHIARQVAEALCVAHESGIVHRDLTPQNIILTTSGVKLIDFGLASLRLVDTATITKTGSLIGTPHYMSPEQVRGERASSAADVYSLGCILYEMLSGAPPFTADTNIAVFYKHATESRPPLNSTKIEGDIRNVVEEILDLSLAKQAERRPAARELSDALQLLEQGKFEELKSWFASRGTAPCSALPSRRRSARGLLLSCTVLFVLAMVLCIVRASLQQRSPRTVDFSDLHHRYSAAQLLNFIDKRNCSPALMESLVSRWAGLHRFTSVDVEHAAILSSDYRQHNKLWLAALANKIGLLALARQRTPDVSLIIYHLRRRAQTLAELKKVETAQSELVDAAKQFSISGPESKETLATAIAQLRLSLAICSRNATLANKLATQSFVRWRDKKCNEETENVAVENIQVMQTFLSEPDCASILENCLGWIRSKSRAAGFLQQHVKPWLELARRSACQGSASTALTYWALIPPKEQYRFEFEAALEDPDISAVFACREDWDRAIRYCLRRARAAKPCMAKLELYRNAIHWQKFSSKSHITDDEYRQIENLFFQFKGSDREVWSDRLYATYCEALESRAECAFRLLQRAMKDPFFDSETPYAVRNPHKEQQPQKQEKPQKHEKRLEAQKPTAAATVASMSNNYERALKYCIQRGRNERLDLASALEAYNRALTLQGVCRVVHVKDQDYRRVEHLLLQRNPPNLPDAWALRVWTFVCIEQSVGARTFASALAIKAVSHPFFAKLSPKWKETLQGTASALSSTP